MTERNGDFRRNVYPVYENKGMASYLPLSREAAYYHRIAEEMSARRPGNNLEELLEDREKGECNWATREPIY